MEIVGGPTSPFNITLGDDGEQKPRIDFGAPDQGAIWAYEPLNFEHIISLEIIPTINNLALYYTKTAQFRRPDLFSSAYGKPTKTVKLVRRLTQADEIVLFSSA
jgi:hypothetical protein